MRILALTRYSRLGASSRLRTYQYKEPLAGHGIEVEIAPLFGDRYISAINEKRPRIELTLRAFAARVPQLLRAGRFDAILIEKEALPWMPALFETMLLPRQVPIILDYDDALFHRYDLHGSTAVRRLLGRKLDTLMSRAALVTAGNTYLADRARSAGAPRVEIVPTVVDLERYPLRSHAQSGRVTIGWIGTPNTARYLDVVKPVVAQIAQERPVRAVAIGGRPDQVNGSPFAAVPWSERTEVEDLRTLDIGIMPLHDTPWERGKCGYKLIQYMALGIPVVASPIGVNETIVSHGRNGFLAADDADWKRALETLLADASLRDAMGEAGRRQIEERFSLQVWGGRVAELFHSLGRA